jgi:sugar lactone lactonase YvrE
MIVRRNNLSGAVYIIEKGQHIWGFTRNLMPVNCKIREASPFPLDTLLNMILQGTLFRFDSDLSRHALRSYLTIPNGIGWSPDQRTLYFTHSSENTLYAYSYSPTDGSISSPRVYYQHNGPGDPDGWKMDMEGNIWQAVYGEGKVLKISTQDPSKGELVGEVELPTRNITCPCFVGEELWITSAEEDEPEKYPESAKYGGGLFRVHVGAAGIKEHKFKMDEAVMKRIGLA